MTRLALLVDGRGFGGAQVYARSLLRHLPPAVTRVVLTTAEHAPHLRPVLRPGDELHVVATTVGTHDPAVVSAALRAVRPDAVHVNLVDPGSMVAALEAAAQVAPAFATLHMTGDLGTGAAHDRLRAAYAGLRHVAAASVPIADVLTGGLGLAASRVTAVRNGVDPVRLPGPARETPAVPVVGILARLTPQKGVDVLLAATALLVDRDVKLEVVIGGTGRDEAALRAVAADLPVRFAGFVPDAGAFLSELDVFCHPSRVDALPLSLLEAMSAGLPCVSSDVGDVRAAVGDAAVVVPVDDPHAVADALERLLLDPAARRALSRAALHRSAGLTAERMVQETWAAFSAEPPPAAPA